MLVSGSNSRRIDFMVSGSMPSISALAAPSHREAHKLLLRTDQIIACRNQLLPLPAVLAQKK